MTIPGWLKAEVICQACSGRILISIQNQVKVSFFGSKNISITKFLTNHSRCDFL